MKKLFFIALVLLAARTHAATGEFSAAEQFYEDKKYDSALVLYKNALEENDYSASLFYAIGNCEYRLGNPVEAIWYYEKAAKLDPSNTNIKANIEFVRKQFRDKINTDRSGISGWFYAIVNGKSANYWSWTSIFLITFSFLSFAIIRMVQSSVARIAVGAGTVALAAGIICIFLAWYQYKSIIQHDQAIVFATTSEIKSAPSENSNTLFVLSEGAKVNITGKNEEWMEISIDESNVGWIKKEDLREI